MQAEPVTRSPIAVIRGHRAIGGTWGEFVQEASWATRPEITARGRTGDQVIECARVNGQSTGPRHVDGVWHADDQLQATINEEGHANTLVYHGANRPIAVINGLGYITSTTYNPDGQVELSSGH